MDYYIIEYITENFKEIDIDMNSRNSQSKAKEAAKESVKETVKGARFFDDISHLFEPNKQTKKLSKKEVLFI